MDFAFLDVLNQLFLFLGLDEFIENLGVELLDLREWSDSMRSETIVNESIRELVTSHVLCIVVGYIFYGAAFAAS